MLLCILFELLTDPKKFIAGLSTINYELFVLISSIYLIALFILTFVSLLILRASYCLVKLIYLNYIK